MTMFGHALDQLALLCHHLFGPRNVPDRLGKMVVLGCHRSNVLARATAGRNG
jgi:hypothetical protein